MTYRSQGLIPTYLLVFILGIFFACQPPSQPDETPEEPPEDTSEADLPEELAFMPNPKVVSVEELTEETLDQEARRSSAEGALVVHYSQDQFDEIYGDIQPLGQQEWWQESAGDISTEEFLSSEKMVGQPFLATVRRDENVYTAQLCIPDNPQREACVQLPEPYGCQCFPIVPSPPPQNGNGGPNGDVTFPVSCETSFLQARGEPCRERMDCNAGCRPAAYRVGVSGIGCMCPDFSRLLLRDLKGK